MDMDRKESRLAVSGVFGVIIAWSVLSNGKGLVVGVGAGLLGAALYWLISRLIFD
jgi:hypothetical protein